MENYYSQCSWMDYHSLETYTAHFSMIGENITITTYLKDIEIKKEKYHENELLSLEERERIICRTVNGQSLSTGLFQKIVEAKLTEIMQKFLYQRHLEIEKRRVEKTKEDEKMKLLKQKEADFLNEDIEMCFETVEVING